MAAPQSRLTRAARGRIVWLGGLVLLAGYGALWLVVPTKADLPSGLFALPFVGIIGAIIANTSGTGGGVVFVPVFNALNDHGLMALDPLRVTAVSMAIQSFGMTMGALRWTDRLLHQPAPAANEANVRGRDYWLLCAAVLVLSLPAMLWVQRNVVFDPKLVLLGYKAFSIVLGLALILATWTINRKLPERTQLAPVDLVVLMLIAVPGGAITALFSVGIGELVAFYLFLRHYPILLSVGTACVISSISMIAGSAWHVANGTIVWEVALLAIPGAVLGGFLARPIALWLGARRLKTYGGAWIVLSAIYLLWLNWS